MDIRSFFGAKKGKQPPPKAKKPEATPASLDGDDAEGDGGTSSKSNKPSQSSPRRVSNRTAPSSAGADPIIKSKKRSRRDATVDDEPPPDPPKKTGRGAVKSDSDEDFVVSATKEKKRAIPTRNNKKARVEISASDYYSKAVSSGTKSVVDMFESSEEEEWKEKENDGFESSESDDDFVATAAPSRSLKRNKSSSPAPPRAKASKAEIIDVTRASPPKRAPPKKESPLPKKAPPKKEASKASATPVKKASAKKSPVRPAAALSEAIPLDAARPRCLEDLTFVFSGILANLSREDSEDYVKSLGGRVTKAVSGKTDYLVCGEMLENNLVYTEGSKYKKAMELGEEKVAVLKGEGEFYALVKLLGGDKKPDSENAPCSNGTSTAKPIPAARKIPTNPYARKTPLNPYAKKRNSNAPSTNAAPPPIPKGVSRASTDDPNALWADKFAPTSTRDILGNGESVKKLNIWLSQWEDTFNSPNANTSKRRSLGPNGPFKAALLSGAPGIGKTTTALLVAHESGRETLEWNASDVRSKKSLDINLGDVTGSRVLSFSKHSKHLQKRVIVMDEVDGMGAGDRSGMASLITLIQKSRVPIICICNDRQNQKIRSLAPHCLDLKFRRPVKSVIARRMQQIAVTQGMDVETNAVEAISESCGNDVRQVLNVMQMWNKKKGTEGRKMTYRDLKERESDIRKDDTLRLSMFDATRMIVEGGKTGLYKRSDAFFTDYNLMGLNVHQNYLKVMISQYQETKRSDNVDAESEIIERMHDATHAMSDYAMVDGMVHGGTQMWSLLPLASIMACKAGHHAAGPKHGFLPGYPEFAGWLGKNSSRNRKIRLLRELNHHMNYKLSADSTELRLSYVPALHEKLMDLMTDENKSMADVISLMDQYGLDRDDLFENLDEFRLVKEKEGLKFADLESKIKAAFTREYNKGVHKSQALVAEQGINKTRKKVKKEEDDDEEEEEEEEDEDDIKKMFEKKGKKNAAKKTAAKKTAAKKTAAKKKK